MFPRASCKGYYYTLVSLMQASCKQTIENMYIPSQSFNSVSPALETGIAKFLNWRGGSFKAIFCQLFQMGLFVCCARHFVLSRGNSRNSWLLVNNYLKHLSGTCTYSMWFTTMCVVFTLRRNGLSFAHLDLNQLTPPLFQLTWAEGSSALFW